MTTLIEDMARAINKAWVVGGYGPEKWCPDAAKAALSVALASLREPSQKMIIAGADGTVTTWHSLRCWQAMLSQWEKENV